MRVVIFFLLAILVLPQLNHCPWRFGRRLPSKVLVLDAELDTVTGAYATQIDKSPLFFGDSWHFPPRRRDVFLQKTMTAHGLITITQLFRKGVGQNLHL